MAREASVEFREGKGISIYLLQSWGKPLWSSEKGKGISIYLLQPLAEASVEFREGEGYSHIPLIIDRRRTDRGRPWEIKHTASKGQVLY